MMNQATFTQDSDLKTRKMIGRGHLSNHRISDAVKLYAGVFHDYPQDIESCLILADFYLAGEDRNTAEKLYHHALRFDPANIEIQKRVFRAHSEASTGRPEPVPTDPKAIERLLQRLTNRPTPVTEQEMERAFAILGEIIHSPEPAVQVAKSLDQIDSLIPALIELNISQARADGRPDLANALQALKQNIDLQLSTQNQVDVLQFVSLGSHKQNRQAFPPISGPVALLVPDDLYPTSRMTLIYESLKLAGCQVSMTTGSPSFQKTRPDVVIACNPHTNTGVMKHLAGYAAAKVPILVDLDTDFEHLPINHPDYNALGLNQMSHARAYATALLLADQVTVPSEILMNSMVEAGYATRLIPDGWSQQNPLWQKQSNPRQTINIGWVGMHGQVEDLLQIRRIIIRVLHEFPQANLVIVGDLKAYQLFESIPQNRRLFLPSVDFEDYPYLLGQIDILLVPLQNRPYNHALSDRIFMEAGIKGIPWVASPIPALETWRTGGVLANTPEDWHLNLRQLVLDNELRSTLGMAGRQLSMGREVNEWGGFWVDAISQLLNRRL